MAKRALVGVAHCFLPWFVYMAVPGDATVKFECWAMSVLVTVGGLLFSRFEDRYALAFVTFVLNAFSLPFAFILMMM